MMKTRGVSFNLDDPQQRSLYEYTKNFTNFSAYMKHLISCDKQKEGHSAPQISKSDDGGYKIQF